jgi:hypothetical protein
LFNEIVAVVLDPSVRSTQQSMLAALGLALIERGAIPDAPIPLLQSVLIVWRSCSSSSVTSSSSGNIAQHYQDAGGLVS